MRDLTPSGRKEKVFGLDIRIGNPTRKVKKSALRTLTGGNEITPQPFRSKILRNRNKYKKIKYHLGKVLKTRK